MYKVQKQEKFTYIITSGYPLGEGGSKDCKRSKEDLRFQTKMKHTLLSIPPAKNG